VVGSGHIEQDDLPHAALAEQKPPGVFRIACVGDSVTFGFNVDDADTYPQLLAQQLERAHPGRFQVLNFGIPGVVAARTRRSTVSWTNSNSPAPKKRA
jgi:lysophospholipase L1-like esterase